MLFFLLLSLFKLMGLILLVIFLEDILPYVLSSLFQHSGCCFI